MFAGVEGGDGQRGVVAVGCADVDDVDVFIADKVFGFFVEPVDVLFFAVLFERFGVDVGEGDEFGVFAVVPAGVVCAGYAADADESNFEIF